MNSINHPNILHLFDFLETNNNYYLVIQLCRDGDLEEYLAKKPKKYLEEAEAVFFIKQMMLGF